MSEPASPFERAQAAASELSLEELRELRRWITTDEIPRRNVAPAVEAARAEDTKKLWEAHPDLKPDFATETVEIEPNQHGNITKAALLKAYPKYRQPTGAHDAYPHGALVVDENEIWSSELEGMNVWRPSEHPRFWLKVTEMLLDEAKAKAAADAGEDPADDTGAVPAVPGEDADEAEPEVDEYRQPSGAHDAYSVGDRVRENGRTYESLINDNVWAPSAYPQGWRDVTP